LADARTKQRAENRLAEWITIGERRQYGLADDGASCVADAHSVAIADGDSGTDIGGRHKTTERLSDCTSE
jgi:hypothetical protein